jgi:hypothetical protein
MLRVLLVSVAHSAGSHAHDREAQSDRRDPKFEFGVRSSENLEPSPIIPFLSVSLD